jgi:hypothetical protein
MTISASATGLLLFVLASFAAQDHPPLSHARANHGMGFDQDRTIHHFLIDRTGGSIEVTAKTATDQDTIGRVRGHLRHIESAFANGDFTLPVFIHQTEPPGAATMKERRSTMTFTFEEMPAGARLVVRTQDAQALAALHDFLRFQIREHKTGDPLEPK